MSRVVESEPAPVPAFPARAFRRRALTWYAEHGRTLPWRGISDPWAILVSELMLQQIGTKHVARHFGPFLERFPTLESLAAAPVAEVLRRFAPLGLNRRALRLHALARAVAEDGGALPRTVEGLRALPGIGEYTARAVACFAFGRRVAVLDTNVARVLHRVGWGPEPPLPLPPEVPRANARMLWQLADNLLPPRRAADWNNAMMDLGATVCTARAPRCAACPVRTICRAGPTIRDAIAARRTADRAGTAPRTPYEQTDRHLRGKTMRLLAALPDGATVPLDELGAHLTPNLAEPGRVEGVVYALERDRLVRVIADDRPDYTVRRVGLPDG